MFGRKFRKRARRPGKPTRRSFGRRKGFRKFRKGVGRLSTMRSRNPTVFSDQLQCKLKHSVKIVVSTAATYTTAIWKGNSIYRPNAGNGDNTTMVNGYTSLFNLYRRCTVHASKIVIRPAILAGTAPIRYVLHPIKGTAAETIANGVIAHSLPYTKYIVCANINTSGGHQKAISMYMPTRKILGVSSRQENDDNEFQMETSTSDPTESWIWQLDLETLDATTLLNANSNIVDVDVTYFCQFSDRYDILTEV